MKTFIFRIGISLAATLSFAILLTATLVPGAHAQMRAMGVPIPTTLVITKPAPGQIFGDQQTVTMGVNGKNYKFGLKDAYVDDPSGKIHWPDIWQLVRQHRPNFNVTGIGEDTFEKIQPGQTMTVRGMFAPLNWNFEVTGTEEGGGPFAPAQHY
jgi:hypothetical protein